MRTNIRSLPAQHKQQVATAQAQGQDATRRRVDGLQHASPLLEFAQWLQANPPAGGSFAVPLPPNLANMPSQGRGHWARRQRMKADYCKSLDSLAALGMIPAPPPVPPEHATITVRLVLRGVMDHDNAMARCKWVVDWLVRRGYLTDDAPAHLSWSGVPVQARCGKTPPRMEIELRRALAV